MRARNPAVGPQQVTFMKRTLIGHDIKASTPVAGRRFSAVRMVSDSHQFISYAYKSVTIHCLRLLASLSTLRIEIV